MFFKECEIEIEALSDGDARRCPRHPGVATSSPDGLFDTPCGLCEAEMEADEVTLPDGRSVPARPCSCGDGSCMLCDDNGMRPELDEERFDAYPNDMKGRP